MQSEEICQSVETKVGIIRGRSSLFLDTLDYRDNALFLYGSLHSSRSPGEEPKDLYYTIIFRDVLAFQMLELDTWIASDWSENRESSFDEVVNSVWIAKLGGKAESDKNKHYSFRTYDAVFDVVCRKYELQLRKEV